MSASLPVFSSPTRSTCTRVGQGDKGCETQLLVGQHVKAWLACEGRGSNRTAAFHSKQSAHNVTGKPAQQALLIIAANSMDRERFQQTHQQRILLEPARHLVDPLGQRGAEQQRLALLGRKAAT